MAYALLPQIYEQINTLSSSTSRPSSSDQPSHILKLREDLEALQRLVRRIQAVLADAEKREIHDESVKLWLRELSDLAYDADDVLDEYDYEIQLRPQMIALDDSTWSKLAGRMGKIRLRFEEISCQRDSLQLREGADIVRQNVAVRQPSSHLPDTPTIFGRQKLIEEVMSMLLSPDGGKQHTLSVLPIVGMGGVGKTTLVQHVYNDQRVCGRFQLKGWVCVSDDFAVDRLTKRIIESLTGEACQLNEFDAIQRRLMQVLTRGRFLVVLDDVWNEMKSFWDSLLKPFRLASVEGSAVILTTRIESIGQIVQTMPFHRLDCMPDDDCWLIFEQHAFAGRNPENHLDLVQIGEKIVKKCKGLPLAVKVLASLLCNEFDHERWEDVLQSELWDVQDQHNEIIPALRLSYLQLPSYLKSCFLYACVFHKDSKFYREELVQLWMAQGFIQCKGRKQVEDVGNMYFDELVQRSFFFRWPGYVREVEYFGMHDLIHDLAKHISGGVISCVGKEEADDDDGSFFQVGGQRNDDGVCPKGTRLCP